LQPQQEQPGLTGFSETGIKDMRILYQHILPSAEELKKFGNYIAVST
jgi:hypothetical protein